MRGLEVYNASKSKPVPRTQRNIQRDVPSNRGYELRRDNDTTKNVQVSLIDHDSIMFYFNEVIKPPWLREMNR